MIRMVKPCARMWKELMKFERCSSFEKRISRSSKLFIRDVRSFCRFLIPMSQSSERAANRGSSESSFEQVSLNLNLADVGM